MEEEKKITEKAKIRDTRLILYFTLYSGGRGGDTRHLDMCTLAQGYFAYLPRLQHREPSAANAFAEQRKPEMPPTRLRGAERRNPITLS